MANQIDGGTEALAAVGGLDQEEPTLREMMAKRGRGSERCSAESAGSPDQTPVGTGKADDAFGTAAAGPAAP
jgi:hypothetical protein